ncbi:hypothetical protein BDZ85DRAFT_316002 [Elsinoe ampelina]|uniref:Myosin-binding striated muscle assembly central-domain-containing protein n=1 Tax=Elsinoe ampelina TaxID=302913 RepID=A0A6A6GLH1_9PEZI|nr:hypothetical protein BDZ85DRAFT_316002 [Elsinoe ampelina]
MANSSNPSTIDLKQIHTALQQEVSGSGGEAYHGAIDRLLEYTRIDKAARQANADDEPVIIRDLLDLLLRIAPTGVASPESETKLLKCCGNLVADNDRNREAFIGAGESLQFLRDAIIFETIGDQEQQYQRAALALKVAFNLCNDYESGQRAALAADLDRSVLQHIHTCLFISKDDTTDLGTELLADLSQHLKDTKTVKAYEKDFVNQVLRLPCVEDVDQDTFLEMATAIGPYLALPRFQEAVLAFSQIHLAFELLEKTIFMLSNSPKADEGRTFEAVLLRSITDISTLPDFPLTFATSSDFVRTLTDRCVLTENDADSANLAVCSCILLGNYATDPAAAAAIVSQIKMDGLHDFITLKAYRRSRTSTVTGIQDHADYLHAAAGMLRHLALPPGIRQKYFRDQASKQTAMALAQYPHVEVQIAGLRLLRQLIVDDFAGLDHIIHSSYHTALLRLYSEPTTDGRVKLEISRTITALLREAAKPLGMSTAASYGSDNTDTPQSPIADATIPTMLAAPNLLEPLAYAITDSKLPLAQAEGYLGLCLILRCSSTKGPQLVSSLIASHPSLLFTMKSTIVGSKDTTNVGEESAPQGEQTTEGEVLPLQGQKTDAAATGVALKARDNAVVLLSELLKSENIDDAVRDSLDSIANEAGITLRL